MTTPHTSTLFPSVLAQEWLHSLFFKQRSTTELGQSTDWLFMYILWVCIISFIVVMGCMFLFTWRYRRSRQGERYQVSSSHNTPLELAWSIIPLLVMVPIFFLGFYGYIAKLVPAGNAEEIRIVGVQWNWSVKYSNGKEPGPDDFMIAPDPSLLGGDMRQWKADTARSGNLVEATPVIYVPAGRAVRLLMTSNDVIHSFYIPAFRVKMDVFPNRYTSLSFTATEPGRDHVVWCAEYCGQNHSEMAAWIRVVPEEDFQAYKNKMLTGTDFQTPAEFGQYIAKLRGCLACHSVDGSANTGPTWARVFGYDIPFADGTSYTAQQMSDSEFYLNYIRESVYDPMARIHEGYPPQMNSYRGLVSEDQLVALAAYIKSLSDKAPQDGAAPGAAQPTQPPPQPAANPS